MKFKLWAVFALAVCLLMGAFTVSAEETKSENQLLVGAAVRDVTPTKDNGLLPIPGSGREPKTYVDVIDPMHTRVIAMQMGEDVALVVCTETGVGPTGYIVAEALSAHTGVPVDSIFCIATHSHAAPEVKSEFSLEPEEGEEVDNSILWARYTVAQILDAADEALANLQPVTVGIGYSESYINANRNRTYYLEDGSSYLNLGLNLAGVTDHTLTVLQFSDEEGNPVAFIVNYPVHGTTMIDNTYFDGEPGISADIPGQISTLLEERYPGCVAMWTSGAAGDQNPIVSNQLMYPDPETGDMVEVYVGEVGIMKYLSYINFADTLQAIAAVEPVDVDAIGFAYGKTEIPNEEGSPSETFTLDLQVLRLGDVAIVGSPGELYTSLGLDIKEASPLENTIVMDLVWTKADSYNFYILDDEGRENGGTMGFMCNYKTGYISDALTTLANDLINEAANE